MSSLIKPRLVWCPTCKKWSRAPASDENICAYCGLISTKCRCTRCGKEWTPRKPIKEGQPAQCYSCNSPYFDRERTRKGEKQ